MNKKQEDQLRFIKIANDLNETFYQNNGYCEEKFYYTTDGYTDIFCFGDKVLWRSDQEERKFVEELNDYEDLKPFITDVFNNWISTWNGLFL